MVTWVIVLDEPERRIAPFTSEPMNVQSFTVAWSPKTLSWFCPLRNVIP